MHPARLPADERRLTAILAAVELAGAANPGDVTTTAIAQRIGVTQPALFRHFPSKDAIWAGVMEWVAERLLANADDAATSSRSPLDALEATFMGHVGFIARHPGVPRVLLAELQRPEGTPAKRAVQKLLRSYSARVRTLLDRAREAGEIAADADSGAAATLFIGTIQGLVLSSLITGSAQRLRADAVGVFAIFRRGIGGRP